MQQLPALREHQPALADFDHRDPSPCGLDTDRRSEKRVFGLDRKRPEAVTPFGAKSFDGLAILRFGKTAIAGDPRAGIRNIGCRQKSSGQFARRAAPLRFFSGKEIEPQAQPGGRGARDLPDNVSTARLRSLQ